MVAQQNNQFPAPRSRNQLNNPFKAYYPKNETLVFSGAIFLNGAFIFSFGCLFLFSVPLNTLHDGLATLISGLAFFILLPGFGLYWHGSNLFKALWRKPSFVMTDHELIFDNLPWTVKQSVGSLKQVSLKKTLKPSKGFRYGQFVNCYHFRFAHREQKIFADEIDISCFEFNKILSHHQYVSEKIDDSIKQFNPDDDHKFNFVTAGIFLLPGMIFIVAAFYFIGKIFFNI